MMFKLKIKKIKNKNLIISLNIIDNKIKYLYNNI
jgi:hypothetical protein